MTESYYPKFANSGPVPEVTPNRRYWLTDWTFLRVEGIGRYMCSPGWIEGRFLEAALEQVPERVRVP